MIDLGGNAGLLAQSPACGVLPEVLALARALPLAHLVANGNGSLRSPVKVRCVECGGLGRLQVRPPVPTLDPQWRGRVSPH